MRALRLADAGQAAPPWLRIPGRAWGGLVRRGWAGFAARGDFAGVLAGGELPNRGGQVDENPVEKIDARQVGRNAAALLVHVVALARNVRVVADHGERTRSRWRVAPG